MIEADHAHEGILGIVAEISKKGYNRPLLLSNDGLLGPVNLSRNRLVFCRIAIQSILKKVRWPGKAACGFSRWRLRSPARLPPSNEDGRTACDNESAI